MRLLCISSHGDTLNSVRPEAELFIGLRAGGVEVTVMTQGDSVYAARMRAAGIEIIDYVPRRKLSIEAIRRIRSVLRDGEFDAVYSFNNKAIVNTNVAAIGLPVAAVTYRGQTGNISRWDPGAYLGHLSPRVDLILCVANAVRDSLRREHRDPERVQTVYKGHDLAWYDDEPADLAEFGIGADAFVVGCVANNRPRKGLPSLIAATHHLAADLPVHLLLIGGGLDDPKLVRAIAASPSRERIHVAGFRRDAPALIAACQASVLPALKREGLPKTVIESMVYAVPPIVTDTGGNAELVEDGVSGIVVTPGDSEAIAAAITRLCRDRDAARRMGEAARRRIGTHFSVTATVEQTRRYIEAAVAARRSAKP